MIVRFRRTRRGVEARFDGPHAALLVSLFSALTTLLESAAGPAPTEPADPLEELVGAGPGEGPREAPADPALSRLFPNAYGEPAAAAEFRRLTQDELRADKLAAVTTVVRQLTEAPQGRLLLEPADAETWLTALNDLRLTLGTRLAVTEDSYGEADRLASDDPRGAQLRVYEWLGYLQETLVDAVAG